MRMLTHPGPGRKQRRGRSTSGPFGNCCRLFSRLSNSALAATGMSRRGQGDATDGDASCSQAEDGEGEEEFFHHLSLLAIEHFSAATNPLIACVSIP